MFHESFCGCVVFHFAGRTRGAGAGVWGRICVLFVLLVFGAVCWNLCACAYLCFSMPSCSSARRPIDRLAQDGWYVPGKLAKCEWKFVSDKVVPPGGGRGGWGGYGYSFWAFMERGCGGYGVQCALRDGGAFLHFGMHVGGLVGVCAFLYCMISVSSWIIWTDIKLWTTRGSSCGSTGWRR